MLLSEISPHTRTGTSIDISELADHTHWPLQRVRFPLLVDVNFVALIEFKPRSSGREYDLYPDWECGFPELIGIPTRSMAKRGMQLWSSNTAWWIVVIYSVPFAVYTLPFIYGDFDIYKYFTIAASRGLMDVAGVNIRNNLRSWQVHAAAALLFVAIGPFQFNAAFRNKHPVLHKRLGYTFAVCTVVTAVTGGTTMRKATEFGPLVQAILPFMSIGTLLSLAISIDAARNKRFQSHRRWMLRSAAIGYSVMYTRTLPMLIRLCVRISEDKALEYSIPLSIAINSGLAELYIQLYLTQPDIMKKVAAESTLTDRTTKKVS